MGRDDDAIEEVGGSGAGSSEEAGRPLQPDDTGAGDGIRAQGRGEPGSARPTRPRRARRAYAVTKRPEGSDIYGQRGVSLGTLEFKPVPPRPRTCNDCPFVPGSALQRTLAEGRLDEFKEHVANGGWFPCHKTSGPRLDAEGHEGKFGGTSWDDIDFLEKLRLIAKEQECVGARIWRDERRAPTPEE